MVKDSDEHDQEDQKRKELVNVRNECDAMIYNTERSLKEFQDKIDPVDRASIQKALDEAKKVVQDSDLAEIRQAYDELKKQAYKFSEHIYQDSPPSDNH